MAYHFIVWQNQKIHQVFFNAIALTSSSNFTIGSTHLPINFFKRLYFGGFIDENEKGKISSVNKFKESGLEIDVNIGVDLFQNKNKGWYINFQNIITSKVTISSRFI